ncbi:anillin-like [Paramacrobiotus metropolitanus]|uniref:anillin-like n=1 Tax=Paramacrobiotus metropolitanus TaxID=2943436 RepID=UPI002445CC5F|nr:anillin-like [Paramacrobiotus metropolitanus]
MADAYESIDEEDAHSDQSTGTHKLQHPSHDPKARNPPKPSRSSGNIAPHFPEKREHVPTGQSPYSSLKIPKTNTTPKKSLDPAELPLQQRKAIFEKAQPEKAELSLMENGCCLKNPRPWRLPRKKPMVVASPEKPTASPRKNVSFSDVPSRKIVYYESSPTKDIEARKHIFETVAAKAQDPNALKKVDTREKKSPLRSSGDFDMRAVDGPVEVGPHTKKLQDKLLQQTKAWKHNDLSKKIEGEKQEDMEVLKHRHELMLAEEQRAAERKKLIEQHAATITHSGMSSLNDMQEVKRADPYDFPPPMFSPPSSQTGRPVADAVARFNNPALRRNVFDDEMLPPPPPPLDDVAMHSKSAKHVRLPEEDGIADHSSEEDYNAPETDDIYTKKPTSYHDVRNSSASKNNYMDFSDDDSPQKAYGGMPNRAPKSPRDQHSENSSDGCSSSVSSITTPTISLSFYRKTQRDAVVSPRKRIVIQDDQQSNASSEDMEMQKVRTVAILQKKIEALHTSASHQHCMLVQTTAALNLCRSTPEFQGSVERAECERLLLLASKKREACHNEIVRLKNMVLEVKTNNYIPDNTVRGKIVINHIILPTKEGFAECMASQSEVLHYFLVLFRQREIVLGTQMVSTLQHLQQDGTFHFTGPLVFEDLENDFTMSVEVYAVQANQEQYSHAEKYHLNGKASGKKQKGGTLKKLLPSLREGSASHVVTGTPTKQEIRQSSFGCVGATTLTLQNLHEKVLELHKVPADSAVEGSLVMEMKCGVSLENREEGFLTVADESNPSADWFRLYCVLNDTGLYFWRYPEERDHDVDPLQFSLRYCKGGVQTVSSTVCPRPHVFQLTSLRPFKLFGEPQTSGPYKYYFAADGKEERFVWMEKLTKALAAVEAWIPPTLNRSVSTSRY